jgi:peptide methionine sulfoxide reductase MsrA
VITVVESPTAERSTVNCELRPMRYCYHQQYLAKNPNGHYGVGGIGVCKTDLSESSPVT